MDWNDILTHHGTLFVSDYLVVIFAAMATIGLQILQVQSSHPDDFKFKVLFSENWIRWVVSLNSALFLLYVVPEGYFWYVEEYTKSVEPGTARWNTLFSAILGLSPLYILKRLIKVSKSKFREVK
jgi:hypothetical protein